MGMDGAKRAMRLVALGGRRKNGGDRKNKYTAATSGERELSERRSGAPVVSRERGGSVGQEISCPGGGGPHAAP